MSNVPESTSMPPAGRQSARNAIVLFWIALFGRSAGENAVRVFMLRELADADSVISQNGLVFIWLLFAAIPAIALGPLAGALAVSEHRKRLLYFCTLVGLGTVGYCTYYKGPWPACLGVLAFETFLFATIRFSLVLPLARAARLPITSVQALWMLATIAGMFVGLYTGLQHDRLLKKADGHIPEPLLIAIAGYTLAFLCLLFTKLPPAESLFLKGGVVAPFLGTFRDIFRERYARRPLVSLMLLFAIGLCLHRQLLALDEYGFIIATAIGMAVGMLHPHPFRGLCRVPVAATLLPVCILLVMLDPSREWPALIAAGLCAWAVPPLLTSLQIYLRPARLGHGGAILFLLCGIVALIYACIAVGYRGEPDEARKLFAWVALGTATVFAIHSWAGYMRPVVESVVELVLGPTYRIRSVGDDINTMPLRGPMLVIANHAAWLDPIWLCKILPFPTTPMMTASFYDLPVISFLMRNVVGTIRVQEVAVRREAPEIKEAIAALDRGEVVVIFPEGWLRRKEEQEIRRFGRGVWQILSARPETPVYAGWVEGSWGSYFSWRGAPPTKGKKFDWFRKITIPIVKARPLSPETLASHIATRTQLLEDVLIARKLLGLAAPAVGADDEPKGGAA